MLGVLRGRSCTYCLAGVTVRLAQCGIYTSSIELLCAAALSEVDSVAFESIGVCDSAE